MVLSIFILTLRQGIFYMDTVKVKIDVFQLVEASWKPESDKAQVNLSKYLVQKSRSLPSKDQKVIILELTLFVTQQCKEQTDRCNNKQLINYLLRAKAVINKSERILKNFFKTQLLRKINELCNTIENKKFDSIEVSQNCSLSENGPLLKKTLAHQLLLQSLILYHTSNQMTQPNQNTVPPIELFKNSKLLITSTIESHRMVNKWIEEFRTEIDDELFRQSDHRQYDLSRIFAYRKYLNQHNHPSSHPPSEGNVSKIKKD